METFRKRFEKLYIKAIVFGYQILFIALSKSDRDCVEEFLIYLSNKIYIIP